MGHNNNELLQEDSNQSLREVAECLNDYLQLHGGIGRNFDVMHFLAEETLKAIDEGRPAQFSNLAIKKAVAGNIDNDASAWLSPIWKRITTEFLPSRAEGLESFAFEKGLEYFPWPVKRDSSGGSGNQALYFLEARKVTKQNSDNRFADIQKDADITYIPAVNLTPSWWAKWFFNRNYAAIGWRKSFFVFSPILWIVLTLVLCSLVWLAMSRQQTPISSQDVVTMIFVGIMVFYCWHVMNRFIRLTDDNIIMAPEHFVGFNEFGVCLEFGKRTHGEKKQPRPLRLVKYAAQCPICSNEVLLDAGEPDFPRRIVGRCQESPREHVFSFDRVTLAGKRLK